MTLIRSFVALVRAHRIVAILLTLIVILGLVLRVNAIGGATRVSTDERSYLGIANNLAGHGSYSYGKDTLHWAPGAPFAYAGVMLLTGKHPLSDGPHGKNAVLYFQALVGTAAILVVFGFAAWLGGSLAGLLAALMTAIYDPLVLVARSYLSEPLGGLLFVSAIFVCCLALAKTDRKWWQAALAGSVLGMAILTRNDLFVLLGLVPLMALLFAWRSEGFQRALILGVSIGGGALALMSPWLVVAAHHEGKFVPVTTAGPTSLWVATYMPAGGRQIILKRQFAAQVCRTFPKAEDACGVSATNLDMRLIFKLLMLRHPGKTENQAVQLELDRNIHDYAEGQPLQFANMLLDKAWRMWKQPWSGGTVGKLDASTTQHRIFVGIALLGWLLGMIFGRGKRRFLTIAFVALLADVAVNTVFVSEARMTLRMTPLLFAFGIGGLGVFGNEMAARWSRSRAPSEGDGDELPADDHLPADEHIPADGQTEAFPSVPGTPNDPQPA